VGGVKGAMAHSTHWPLVPVVAARIRGEPQAIPHGSELILIYNWLQVLGTTETPQIDQGVGHQFHPVVALLDVLETEEQPLEFVLPRKRPLDALP